VKASGVPSRPRGRVEAPATDRSVKSLSDYPSSQMTAPGYPRFPQGAPLDVGATIEMTGSQGQLRGQSDRSAVQWTGNTPIEEHAPDSYEV
jgi:hypothetical protein